MYVSDNKLDYFFLFTQKAEPNFNEETESKEGKTELPESAKNDDDNGKTVELSESKQQQSDSDHSEHSEHLESKHSGSEASEAKNGDGEQESKSPDSRCSERSQPILQPPASYQALEQSSDNSDSSNNRTIESSQNNSFSDNSQIVPNTVDGQIIIINDGQPDDQLSDHQPDEQLNEECVDRPIIGPSPNERDQNDNLPSPPTTPSDDTVSSEPPKSCLSRRCSSKSSIKKKVNYSDSKEYIDVPTVTDDDEVFSDSISPQLPRGDMCTPYPKKKSSIPGMSFPSDWFPDDRWNFFFLIQSL